MGHMLVKVEIVVYDGMLGMIELDQVLERPGSLVRICLDVVEWHCGEVDGWGRAGEETRDGERVGNRRE